MIGLILTIQERRKSPIMEMNFLVLALFILILPVLLLLISTFVSSSDGIEIFSLFLFRLTFFPIAIGLIFFISIFFFPSFRASYKSLIFFGALIFIQATMAFINFYTSNLEVVGEFMRFEFSPLGAIMMLIGISTFSFVAFIRFREIRNLRKNASTDDNQPNSQGSPVYGAILAILFIMIAILTIITELFPDYPLPMMLLLILLSIMYIVIPFSLKQGKHLLFIIPEKAYAVIITEQRSGLVIFSESFTPESQAEDLLGGLFTALNISLKETIQSESDLEEISFGDRVVHIAPGQTITTLFITSKKTLMTSYLTRHLTRTFEKKFHLILNSKMLVGLNTENFKTFTAEANEIRLYFAE